MFILSLIYNVIHTWCLFYQVITLNVAVNSYSNSLLTLLISNQFVEIKGSVFKRIEKENLFQLTCSDVVERFQLWIILLIIGMRNVVEVGGLSVPGAGGEMDGGATTKAGPLHTTSILPASFTVLPSWLLSGEVLSPFLVVIGIEMLVDWIKHAYINKFNNVKPAIYSRMLDVLCKDYYTNVCYIRLPYFVYNPLLTLAHYIGVCYTVSDSTTWPAATAAILLVYSCIGTSLSHVPRYTPPSTDPNLNHRTFCRIIYALFPCYDSCTGPSRHINS